MFGDGAFCGMIGAFSDSCRVNVPGVFVIPSPPPPLWDDCPSQGRTQREICRCPVIKLGGAGHCESKSYCSREHNTVSQARTRTRTTRSGVERTKYEAILLPYIAEWGTIALGINHNYSVKTMLLELIWASGQQVNCRTKE